MLTIDEFVRVLHHHNTDVADTYACTYSEVNAEKTNWKDYGVEMESSIAARLNPSYNAYTSVNNYQPSIIGKQYRGCRGEQYLHSLNGFFVDLDCHQGSLSNGVIETTTNFVKSIIDESPLKFYTMCVFTGRGLAFYYLYDTAVLANPFTIAKHTEMYSKVFDAFEHVLRFVPSVEIDRCVKDTSRVCRIPGTINTKVNQYAKCLEYHPTHQYAPCELYSFFTEEVFGITQFEKRVDTSALLDELDASFDFEEITTNIIDFSTHRPRMSIISFDNIESQCKVLIRLAALRGMNNGQGRHNLLFIFYCNQKALGLPEAKENTRTLNQSFQVPIHGHLLEKMMTQIDHHRELSGLHEDGFYIFKRETIRDWLHMTASEQSKTGLFKNREKKQRTTFNKRQKERDESIVKELLLQGHTYRSIQKTTGRSNGFIARISKEMKHSLFSSSIHSNLEHNVGSVCGSSSDLLSENTGVVSFPRPMEDDFEMEQALATLLSGENVYLSGKGGVGKSYLSNLFVTKMREMGKKVVLAAPSGLAASTIHGQTVHAILQMDANHVYLKGEQPSLRILELLKDVDCILLDECGMLRMDHFAYLTNCLQAVYRKFYKRIQFVVVGDFLQLPPVVTKQERESLKRAYGTHLFYQAYEDAELWNHHHFKVCNLTKNHRQSNHEFTNYVNALRVGDSSVLPYFRQFEDSHAKYKEDGYLHLCAYRKEVDDINHHIMEQHKQDASYQTFQVHHHSEETQSSFTTTQTFYEGMPVMSTLNTKRGYQNGSLGVVTKVEAHAIWVKFQSLNFPIRIGKVTTHKNHITCKQFPLVPAYAMTIHKCQSQTLDKVVVHQGMFEEGQAYVAISRVKSPEGLLLCGTLSAKDIKRPILEQLKRCETLGFCAEERELVFG